MNIFLKSLFVCISTVLLFPIIALGQITITITSLPENTPKKDKIHFAGNINNWNPSDDNFIFKKLENHYSLIFTPPSNGVVEFKCTRGNWTKVEGNSEGKRISNHAIVYEGKPTTFNLTIESWEDLDGQIAVHTASENVSILSKDFFIPQLNRKRRVWIYLPPHYHSASERYPVLYMHDGQNAFDELTSFAGEWKVDESLDNIYAKNGGCILVAVDNGLTHRSDEYSPWANKNEDYGGGEGAEYVDFLVETLKPHIDQNYRTLSDRENTGIMGSSMGGLISLYAGLEYPEVFSKLGVFSPAFWFSDKCYEHVQEKGHQLDAKIFMLIGRLEGERYVTGMASMYNVLLLAGFSQKDIFYLVDEEGQHNEASWAKQFPNAFTWLFDVGENKVTQSELPLVKIKQKGKIYSVDVPKDLGEISLEIYRRGKKVRILEFEKSGEFPARFIGKKLRLVTIRNDKGIIIGNQFFNRD